MRVLVIFAGLIAAMGSVPAAAATVCAPGVTVAGQEGAPLVPVETLSPATPAKLAPLAASSPWQARFAEAADSLLAALQSHDMGRWQPLLGGQWLGAAERAQVQTLIDDPCGAFAPVLASDTPVARRILGWNAPSAYSDSDLAEIAARPEAEALICWSAKADVVWPTTARDADNRAGRPYACARITYSVRGDTPVWRGFIEQSRP